MMGESDFCIKSDHKSQIGVVVWTLWWVIHVWRWSIVLPKPLFQSLMLNEFWNCLLGINTHWRKNLIIQNIQPVSWPHLLGSWHCFHLSFLPGAPISPVQVLNPDWSNHTTFRQNLPKLYFQEMDGCTTIISGFKPALDLSRFSNLLN